MELRLRRGAQLLGRFQVTVHCFRDSAHRLASTAALGPQVEIEVRSPVPAYLARTGTT
jgi:hypothetical protein